MDITHQTQPAQLEKSSFVWSEVRLVVAAVALFLGGIPPVLYFGLPSGLYSLTNSLLQIAWIISGVASVYLLYRWNEGGRKLFGAQLPHDTYAFFVGVVSGINLGLTGLTGNNIGMSFSSNRIVFLVVGVAYLWAANHLWSRWRATGEKLF